MRCCGRDEATIPWPVASTSAGPAVAIADSLSQYDRENNLRLRENMLDTEEPTRPVMWVIRVYSCDVRKASLRNTCPCANVLCWPIGALLSARPLRRYANHCDSLHKHHSARARRMLKSIAGQDESCRICVNAWPWKSGTGTAVQLHTCKIQHVIDLETVCACATCASVGGTHIQCMFVDMAHLQSVRRGNAKPFPLEVIAEFWTTTSAQNWYAMLRSTRRYSMRASQAAQDTMYVP